jgi:ketosteroid isomerase-like protein
MFGSDLAQAMEEYFRALDAFVKGDPEPVKNLMSRRDDVTLANPIGPPVRGWKEVAEMTDRAASQGRDGEFIGWETISEYATPELAYVLGIQRSRLKLGGADEFSSVSLRVTTIFRHEENGWKIVHRHADPITSPRPIQSVGER